MGPSLDAAGIPSSLTQRRQAASNLPAFELPPPTNLQFAAQQYAHKFPPLSGSGHMQMPAAAVSVGNLLTPPSNSASESGASSNNMHNGVAPNGHSMPVLPYTPTFWHSGGATPNGIGSGLTPQSWHNSHNFGSRSMFSPLPAHMGRSDPNSPSTGSALPPPPYDMNNVQSFPTGVSMASAASAAQNTASMTASMMGQHMRPQHQTSPISPVDSMSKATSAPGIYSTMAATASPQPPYGFSSATPVSQSPHSNGAPSSTTSPPIQQGQIPQMQTQNGHFIKPPYPSYTLPAMPGPILTNVNNPNHQMTMIPGGIQPIVPMHFNSSYAANPQFGLQGRSHSPAQPPNQDRPFKCDECPQSFNRNHDLKRHKRIHLAVKPFPCNYCDKSFSRKDALKRHILVKGCGKSGDNPSIGDGVKSDSGSDTQDASMVGSHV